MPLFVRYPQTRFNRAIQLPCMIFSMSASRVAAVAQHPGNPCEIGDRVEIARGLLGAVAAVEIGADGGVAGVAGQLADMIDVIDEILPWLQSAGVVSPLIQPGVIIQASSARADHPAALDRIFNCSSVNWRSSGTSARQLEWVARTGPWKVSIAFEKA